MQLRMSPKVLTGMFAGSLLLLAGSTQAQNEPGYLELGVVWGEGGTLADVPRFSGLTGRYWLNDFQAIHGGLRYTSAGDNNLGLFGEVQHHFSTAAMGSNSLFIGGGVYYQEAQIGPDEDDIFALYAPVGFQFPMSQHPITFTLNSSLTLYIDPDSEIEIGDEVRVGVHYRF